jgi:hypothetical protein
VLKGQGRWGLVLDGTVIQGNPKYSKQFSLNIYASFKYIYSFGVILKYIPMFLINTGVVKIPEGVGVGIQILHGVINIININSGPPGGADFFSFFFSLKILEGDQLKF